MRHSISNSTYNIRKPAFHLTLHCKMGLFAPQCFCLLTSPKYSRNPAIPILFYIAMELY